MKKKKELRGQVLRLLLILAAVLALAACVYVLWRSGWLEKINSVEKLRELIASKGAMGSVIYFILQLMTVIIAPIPSNVSMMAGALALGFVPAVVLGILAVLLGSIIMFLLARRLGRNAMQRFLDKGVLEKYMPIIEEKQDVFLLLTMLFPFFPDDALCILAGLTNIPFERFVLIAVIGRPWGLIFAALLGSGVLNMPAWGWAVLILPMILLFVLAMRNSDKIENAILSLITRLTPKRRKGKKQ